MWNLNLMADGTAEPWVQRNGCGAKPVQLLWPSAFFSYTCQVQISKQNISVSPKKWLLV